MFYHYITCPHLFILFMILHSNVQDNNDNVFANVTLVMNTCTHAVFQKAP